MTDFHQLLLDWFRLHQRSMPWRKNVHSDPYAVWVSEAMLQQTTVATVVPFFERWMERFPTAEALAAASEDEVLRYWQGLGYYSRARNLLKGIRIVVENAWPNSVADWRKVPGVGDYTAGAIASIAQGIATPVVDGNVERVFARICLDGSAGALLKKNAWRWADSALYRDSPGEWNQALMELGATICTPKSPKCGSCPVSGFCGAFQSERVEEFPAPKPKRQWVDLRHVTVVPIWGSQVGLVQAGVEEWWSGLWHPPRGDEWSDFGTKVGGFKHVVTKHRISLEVRRWDVEEEVEGLTFVPLSDLSEWAISAPGRRAISMALDRGLGLPGLE